MKRRKEFFKDRDIGEESGKKEPRKKIIRKLGVD